VSIDESCNFNLTGAATCRCRYKNVTVQHRINAWTLLEHYPDKRFDLVVWNHPHLGVEDFRYAAVRHNCRPISHSRRAKFL
jgi:hypothetical protein